MVSEVVGETVWQHHPKPKSLPIPKRTKPKQRAEPKKRKLARPFNKHKTDKLSGWCHTHAVWVLYAPTSVKSHHLWRARLNQRCVFRFNPRCHMIWL